MKGFGIEIKNDLLDPKHVEAMDIAVWLYMWCLDKMTSINEEGIGLVLGGKPIKFDDVVELGISLRTYRRWVKILENAGYINSTRKPNGLILSVNKAHKWFNKGYAKNGTSQKTSDVPNLSERSAENGTSDVPELAHAHIQYSRQSKDTSMNDIIHGSIKKDAEYVSMVKEFAAVDFYAPGAIHSIITGEFLPYWREKSPGGKKERWEMERVFDPKRRIATWLMNNHKRQKDYKCKKPMWHRAGETCHCFQKTAVVNEGKPFKFPETATIPGIIRRVEPRVGQMRSMKELLNDKK